MKDVEIIGMLKSYIKKSLIGIGALKGAPCTIKSITYDSENKLNTVVFEWEDDNGDKHTSTMLVYDGRDGINGTNGTNGQDGADGFSPEIKVKTSTSSEYILTITTEDGSFDTPNLKGSGGGGGASALSDLSDVVIADLANDDVLIYDSTAGKWKNADDLATIKLDIADLKGSIVTLTGKVNSAAKSISVNGVAQTITAGAVDLDVASNLIPETQWTEVQTILS